MNKSPMRTFNIVSSIPTIAMVDIDSHYPQERTGVKRAW